MATVDKTHKIYTDQMGKFPITSSRVNKYILIMYVYDDNVILASPLNSRSGSHILEAYTKQVEHLTNIRYRPQVHWFDKEASDSLKNTTIKKILNTSWCPHIFTVSMHRSGPSGHGKITLLWGYQAHTTVSRCICSVS